MLRSSHRLCTGDGFRWARGWANVVIGSACMWIHWLQLKVFLLLTVPWGLAVWQSSSQRCYSCGLIQGDNFWQRRNSGILFDGYYHSLVIKPSSIKWNKSGRSNISVRSLGWVETISNCFILVSTGVLTLHFTVNEAFLVSICRPYYLTLPENFGSETSNMVLF